MKLKKLIGVLSLLIASTLIWYFSYTVMAILYFDNSNTGIVVTPPTESTSTQNITYDYTPETLAQYNGQNGNPAYIAVNGNVYDVSSLPLWKTGEHFGMVAGVDLTNLFSKSPHDLTILDRAVKIGTFGSNSTDTSGNQSTTISTEKTFTLEELSQYNGKDGQPPYIALNGLVYDVSNLVEWRLGQHYGGVKAGTDITLEFPNSPHTFTILNRANYVGILLGDTPKVTPDMLKGTGEDDEEEDDD